MRSSRTSPVRLGALGVVVLAVFAGGCAGSDDADPGGSSDAAASGTGGSDAGTGTTPAGDATNPDCVDVHAGHSAMMWNPTMADEMIDADCGWPYDPFLVTLDGGADDAALDAPFVATRFDELWTAISSSGVGVCSVATELDGDGVGRAFGFAYLVGPPGCPGAESTGALRVSEFGTEAQRDTAALAAAEGDDETFVLGRWVITLEGESAGLTESLEELGAQQVT